MEKKSSIVGGNILEVTGIDLDGVSILSDPYLLMDTTAEQLNVITKRCEILQLDHRAGVQYILKGTLGSAFHSTMFADRFHEGSNCRELHTNDVQQWLGYLKDTHQRLCDDKENATLSLPPVMRSHIIAVLRRRFFISAQGYIGVCPESVKLGDRIFVLSCCPAPIFLRPVKESTDADSNKYSPLGHGYVHGMMNGEAAEMNLPVTTTLIV